MTTRSHSSPSAESPRELAPPRGIFYGWWIVLATAFINFWGAGAFNFSFTAFLRPMVQEMGWSYAGISVAMSLRSLEGGIMSPTVGYLTDKIGPRRILLAGAFLAGASAILLSRIGSLWAFYTLFVLLSMGFSMMMPVPGATAIAHWFSRKRGTALGLSSAAYGASGVLIPLIAWIIAQHSWRTAFVVAGVGMWAIGIPAALMVRHRPEPYGLLPDGDSLSSGQGNTRSLVGKGLTHEEDGLSVRQAVRTRAFWMISMVATVSGVGLSVMSLHVMPSLLSVNIPLVTAGFIASLFPLASIPGRIGFGWLGDHIDRIDKRHLLTVAVLLNVLGLLIFAFSHTVPLAVLAMTLFGVGFGGVNTLRVALPGDYFGRRAFGSIQGLMHTPGVAGSMLAPVLAGWVFDVRGSYQLAWIFTALVVAASIPLTLLIPARKASQP